MFFAGAKIEGIQLPAKEIARKIARRYRIIGDGQSLENIPFKLLEAIQMDSKLRMPARMWFYIREHVGSKVYVKEQRHRSILHAGGFTNHQIREYLRLLVDRKFMGRDKKGNFYCRKLSVVSPVERWPSGALKKSLHRSLSHADIADAKTWKNLLRGNVVMACAESLTRGKMKKEAACFVATTYPGGIVLSKGKTISRKTLALSSKVQGVSLSIVASRTGKSKSTASRWRSSGQSAGYKLYEWFAPTDDFIPQSLPYRLARFRSLLRNNPSGAAVKVDPNTIVFRYVNGTGKVLTQMPSQVVIDKPVFFMAL